MKKVKQQNIKKEKNSTQKYLKNLFKLKNKSGM